MKKILIISLTVVLAGCFTAKAVKKTEGEIEKTPTTQAHPYQSEVDRVQAKFPGYTVTDLERGKGLYEQHCMQCHELFHPASHNEDQWRKIVPNMANLVNKKGAVLDASGEEDILKYVITMSGS
ncbi:MAG: hypothetical protein K0R65_1471 [Crocinitomicaceae bacterium]|jgi:cytochrome c5|nr:hypothetical protein [Crocinitomicaceae bacterium]